MTISIAQVQKLRQETGAGIVDCRKALDSTGGEMEEAREWLRKNGIASGLKKATRVAGDGVIGALARGTNGVILEVNSETDFVARSDDFKRFVAGTLEQALAHNVISLEDLLPLAQESALALAGKVGENVVLRRVARVSVSQGVVVSYIHGSSGKIGVLVALESSGKAVELHEVGKKIAMHIAASHPQYCTIDQVPEAVIRKEREFLSEQASDLLNSPVQAKVNGGLRQVEAGMRKFFQTTVLEQQSFVFDSEIKVEDFLSQESTRLGCSIAIVQFVRFALGTET